MLLTDDIQQKHSFFLLLGDQIHRSENCIIVGVQMKQGGKREACVSGECGWGREEGGGYSHWDNSVHCLMKLVISHPE